MRPNPFLVSLLVLAACGNDSGTTGDDSPADGSNGSDIPARVIPGGGIGDGPIDGVANIYAIDDATRTPIAGASVTLSSGSGAPVTGTTDATGLFTAEGVHGAQDVTVAADDHRTEVWLGANGTNITIDLHAQVDATPASANLSGVITGFDGLTVAAGHSKVGVVAYSQDDRLSDAENNLVTANNGNLCIVAQNAADQTCPFTITARTGKVALVAVILDFPPGQGATPTLLGWATRTGVTVAAGTDQTGQDLALVGATDEASVTVDFGTPPTGLTNVAAVVGVELGDEGTLQLGQLAAPTSPTVLVPKLSVFPSGATYRLTGIAKQDPTDPTPQSVILHRGLTGTSLDAGTWLDLPKNITVSHTAASWTAPTGALVSSVEYLNGTTHLMNVTAFDNRASITLPTSPALPSGVLTANVQSIQATIDVTNFSLDTDRDKLTGVSQVPATAN